MSEFKDWLKKNTKEMDTGHVPYSGATVLRVIEKSALGEWAWEEAIGKGHIKAILKDGFINWNALKEEFVVEGLMDSLRSNPRTKQLYEIAVGCLGKREIQKRLGGR